MLKKAIDNAVTMGKVKKTEFERLNVDTTVQSKLTGARAGHFAARPAATATPSS